MNRTAQKHLDAIRAGYVDQSNVIGLRKPLNATERTACGYSVGATSCTVSFDDLDTIVSELHRVRPVVAGALHDSGLALLRSPRYRKRLEPWRSALERIAAFRLVDFEQFDRWHHVPVFRCEDVDGNYLFTFRNIPWQSGGDGPEIIGSAL
jgi:hypothetical protein